MEDLISLSIGIGLVVSLTFSEMLGLTAGGMVVPGYIALYLDRPLLVLITILVSYLTYFIVHSMSAVMIIYGRRRTVLMILVGYAMGALLRSLGHVPLPGTGIEVDIIGYIVPGLIAVWIDRQGFVESVSSLIIASVIVRMLLILISGGKLLI